MVYNYEKNFVPLKTPSLKIVNKDTNKKLDRLRTKQYTYLIPTCNKIKRSPPID